MDDLPGDDRKPFEIGPLSWDYGLRVAGELDLLTSRQLAAALDALDREEEIVLDLQEVTFIDSTGMYVLLTFARSFEPSRPLVVANPPPAVLRLLELASVSRLPTIRIRIDETVGEPVSLAEQLLERAQRTSPAALEPDAAA